MSHIKEEKRKKSKNRDNPKWGGRKLRKAIRSRIMLTQKTNQERRMPAKVVGRRPTRPSHIRDKAEQLKTCQGPRKASGKKGEASGQKQA